MDKLRGCPLSNGNTCNTENCKWWNDEWKDCAMNVLVRYLQAQDVRAIFDHAIPAEFLEGSRK